MRSSSHRSTTTHSQITESKSSRVLLPSAAPISFGKSPGTENLHLSSNARRAFFEASSRKFRGIGARAQTAGPTVRGNKRWADTRARLRSVAHSGMSQKTRRLTMEKNKLIALKITKNKPTSLFFDLHERFQDMETLANENPLISRSEPVDEETRLKLDKAKVELVQGVISMSEFRKILSDIMYTPWGEDLSKELEAEAYKRYKELDRIVVSDSTDDE